MLGVTADADIGVTVAVTFVPKSRIGATPSKSPDAQRSRDRAGRPDQVGPWLHPAQHLSKPPVYPRRRQPVKRQRVWLNGPLPKPSTLVGATRKTWAGPMSSGRTDSGLWRNVPSTTSKCHTAPYLAR